MLAQSLVGETTDEELTAQQETKQRGVLFSEEIEALVATVVVNLGFSQLVKLLHADLWCLNVGNELEIAMVGSMQQIVCESSHIKAGRDVLRQPSAASILLILQCSKNFLRKKFSLLPPG